MTMLQTKVPVLIVGGGIGGLTTALALHRAGISSQVILKEKSFSAAHRNVVVAGSAVRILDRLGLGPLMRTHGVAVTHGRIETDRGVRVLNIDVSRLGSEVWVMPRSHLQQFFVESLPPDTVHFGTRLRSLHTHPKGEHVIAELLHNPHVTRRIGYPDSRNFTSRLAASLVVGADGLSSAVRSSIWHPTITSTSTCVWHSVTMVRDEEAYPSHAFREFWQTRRAHEIPPTRFGFARMSQEEVAWWAVAPCLNAVYLRPFQPKLIKLFQQYPNCVLRLIESVSNDRDINRRQLKQTWSDSSLWIDKDSNRIALVGDAGRAGVLATLHQGCSFAIEDSYMLAHYIAEQGGPESPTVHIGLRAYEQNRLAHTAMAKVYSQQFHKLAASRSSISRYLLRNSVLSSLENESLREIARTAKS